MIYRFGEFELDLATLELRASGALVALEPQVFALLALLVEHRERVVSRDELVEKVWDGRVVSDAAVASRVKSARRALGDDGERQVYIRTLQRQGFRFVAAVQVGAATQAGIAGPDAAFPDAGGGRPSIAVLPFRLIGDPGMHGAIAEAVPYELIIELSRLRWLFVTARGSSFRLRDGADPVEVGRLLGVRYCLSGAVEIAVGRLGVTVALADTRDGSVIWAERHAGSMDEVHAVRELIRSQVIAALDIEIPAHEAKLAGLAVTGDLDAWAAYHLGLQQIYRFTRDGNAAAGAFFERALQRDPGFARAHAGLSFVHFQTAFMRHGDGPSSAVAAARRAAERALELDTRDPFCHFAMGRSYWLEGDLEGGLPWLERATALSPNYAQGFYARAWTETLAGAGLAGREHVDLALRLSPLDPLHYAMLGTRAFTHMVLNEDADAADWADRAARSPGAHVLIAMIACVANALAGEEMRAAAWARNVRQRNPALTASDFFRAFPLKPPGVGARVAAVLGRFGF